MPAKAPLAGDKIDRLLRAPFHFVHTVGCLTRTRNVREYVLVLTLCLVGCVNTEAA